MLLLRFAQLAGLLGLAILAFESAVLIPRQIDDAYIPVWKRIVAISPFVLGSIGLCLAILGRRMASRKRDVVLAFTLSGLAWSFYPAVFLFALMYAA